MRYFDTFAGVGGFSLGIEMAYGMGDSHEQERSCVSPSDKPSTSGGSERDLPVCVGFSEIDKHASAVLRYRFPDIKNYGDITKIDWSAVSDFDLLVGGSPCQDFSIAGKRAGLVGVRSGLFGDYVRALHEKKPLYFIWENVKGVLSSNGGRDFAVILNSMAEAGYSLWWQVLNAKDFGVPQNRERVFVIGTRNGSPREIFFERGDAKEGADGSEDTAKQPISPTLNTGTGGRHTPMFSKTIRKGGAKSPHGSKQNWDSYEVGSRIRRLTPVECERLMSWPDDWTRYMDYGDGKQDYGPPFGREMSDTQRYKMCGNGVVSRVVAEVVKAYILSPKE